LNYSKLSRGEVGRRGEKIGINNKRGGGNKRKVGGQEVKK